MLDEFTKNNQEIHVLIDHKLAGNGPKSKLSHAEGGTRSTGTDILKHLISEILPTAILTEIKCKA